MVAEENVRPPGDTIGAELARLLEHRQPLSAEEQGRRTRAAFDGHPPGRRGLIGVGRPHHHQTRDRPQGQDVLDRLMRRAVLSHPNRIVGEDVDHRLLHQGCKANGRPHVVGKDQKGRSIGSDSPVQRESVEDRPHRVLADAEVQIPVAEGVREQISAAVDQ